MAQIDHLIQEVAEKVIGHGAAFKNSQKTTSIEYLFESSDHPQSPQLTSVYAGCKGFAGATPYKVDRDFVPISLVGLLNTALIAHPSVKELIERLKKLPGSVVAASSGVGSYSHLAGEWFAASAGVKIDFVPYNTSSPFGDLVAGQVQLMFDALPAAIGNVKASKLKILALTGKTRHPNFPDVPTFAEADLSDYTPTAWTGLFAPAGTPAPIISKLADAMQKATEQNSDLIAKWRSYPGDLKSQMPVEFTALLKQDSQLWGQAIRGTGIKLD